MTRRTSKTKTSDRSNLRKMPCTGCGRHAKMVDAGVTARFCTNCFTVNGNYQRYLKGLDMIKPIEGIRVKDLLVGVDGKTYKVVGREDVSGEDKFYYCQCIDDKKNKEVIVLGDFFFVARAAEGTN